MSKSREWSEVTTNLPYQSSAYSWEKRGIFVFELLYILGSYANRIHYFNGIGAYK